MPRCLIQLAGVVSTPCDLVSRLRECLSIDELCFERRVSVHSSKALTLIEDLVGKRREAISHCLVARAYLLLAGVVLLHFLNFPYFELGLRLVETEQPV